MFPSFNSLQYVNVTINYYILDICVLHTFWKSKFVAEYVLLGYSDFEILTGYVAGGQKPNMKSQCTKIKCVIYCAL